MVNFWLTRREFRNFFPIGKKIRVTGPFDIMNEPIFGQYIGEYGTVIDYMFEGTFWVGVIMDMNQGLLGNNTNWFAPSEIELYYEDYIC
jgi:hypothetical protein